MLSEAFSAASDWAQAGYPEKRLRGKRSLSGNARAEADDLIPRPSLFGVVPNSFRLTIRWF